jgi:pimeloyl-ACP methyl ester carboxylesterase
LFFKGKHTDGEQDILANAMLKDSKFTDLVKAELKKSDPNFRESWAANTQTIIPKDEIEIVQNTNIPIAVVHGNNDDLVNLEYIKTVPFKNLWNNKIYEIPEAGHLPFLEQADTYNKYLMDFCNQQF